MRESSTGIDNLILFGAGAVLFLVGLAAGFFSPPAYLPHPTILLVLTLILLDVVLSVAIALREGRRFNGLVHLLVLGLVVLALLAMTLVSGLRVELTLLLPLIIREMTLIGRLF